MDWTLAPETIQLLQLIGNAAGIVLAIITFAIGLAELGTMFLRTHL